MRCIGASLAKDIVFQKMKRASQDVFDAPESLSKSAFVAVVVKLFRKATLPDTGKEGLHLGTILVREYSPQNLEAFYDVLGALPYPRHWKQAALEQVAKDVEFYNAVRTEDEALRVLHTCEVNEAGETRVVCFSLQTFE
jgi:hypothetical protein